MVQSQQVKAWWESVNNSHKQPTYDTDQIHEKDCIFRKHLLSHRKFWFYLSSNHSEQFSEAEEMSFPPASSWGRLIHSFSTDSFSDQRQGELSRYQTHPCNNNPTNNLHYFLVNVCDIPKNTRWVFIVKMQSYYLILYWYSICLE